MAAKQDAYHAVSGVFENESQEFWLVRVPKDVSTPSNFFFFCFFGPQPRPCTPLGDPRPAGWGKNDCWQEVDGVFQVQEVPEGGGGAHCERVFPR